MNDLDRMIILLNEFIFFEEARLIDEVDLSFQNLKYHKNDSYYILKYFENVSRLEYFNIFSKKVLRLIKNFSDR